MASETAPDLGRKLGPGNFRGIAKRAGYTTQYVSRVLRGKIHPSFDGATAIADAAGVTLDELRQYLKERKEEEVA